MSGYSNDFPLFGGRYGWVFIGYWTATWAVTGVGIYSGIMLFDVNGLALLQQGLDFFGVREEADEVLNVNEWSPGLVNVIIAAEINELIEPLRLPLVISTTPAFARWWRQLRNKK